MSRRYSHEEQASGVVSQGFIFELASTIEVAKSSTYSHEREV